MIPAVEFGRCRDSHRFAGSGVGGCRQVAAELTATNFTKKEAVRSLMLTGRLLICIVYVKLLK